MKLILAGWFVAILLFSELAFTLWAVHIHHELVQACKVLLLLVLTQCNEPDKLHNYLPSPSSPTGPPGSYLIFSRHGALNNVFSWGTRLEKILSFLHPSLSNQPCSVSSLSLSAHLCFSSFVIFCLTQGLYIIILLFIPSSSACVSLLFVWAEYPPYIFIISLQNEPAQRERDTHWFNHYHKFHFHSFKRS